MMNFISHYDIIKRCMSETKYNEVIDDEPAESSEILLINIHEECVSPLLSSLGLENKGKAPCLLDEQAWKLLLFLQCRFLAR